MLAPVRRSSPCHAAIALGLAVALAERPARADDASELEGLLDESVVSAPSKQAETARTSPATSTTITADDLRRYGIRSLDEAVNFLSMGMLTEDPLGTVEIGARGVLITQDFGSHVLLLVDGHAVNEPWGGSAYFERGAGIPLELVDHIEVILGPGSVLYGTSAVLGVIHVVTKRAKDYEGLHLVVESELPTSIRGAAGYGHEFRLGRQPAEITFQGEYYAQHGPSFDFGPQPYGNDSVTGLARRFSADAPPGVWGGTADDAYYTRVPAGYLRMRVGDVEAAVRGVIYDRSYPYSGGNFDDPDNHEVDRWLSLDLRHHASLSSVAQLQTRLYGDLYDYQQFYTSNAAEDCLDGQDQGCLYYLVGVARWAGLEPQLSLDWTKDGRFVTMLGLDGRVRYVFSKVDITDAVTDDNPGSFGVYRKVEKAGAAFLQQTAQPVRWLWLNGGVRIDVDERYPGAHVSPRAAVTVSPWTGGYLKVLYAEAFRAPTSYDTYYADPTSQVAAPNLQPEVVRSVEITFEQRVRTQRMLFGVFASRLDDLVVTQTLTNDEIAAAIAAGQLDEGLDYAEQARNLDAIDTMGWNAAYDGSAVQGRLRYGASFTAAHARRKPVDGDPVELPAAAQIFGNARISYDLAGGLPTLALATRAVGPRLANDPEAPRVPSQAELRATISGPVPKLEGLSYRVGANYAAARNAPYVAGPTRLATGERELVPVDRFRVAVGLQYDLVP